MVVHPVKRNAKFLRRLARTKSEKIRQKLLSKATRSQLQTLQEICHNLLKFRVGLKAKHLRKLKPYAQTIRQVATPGSEERVRRVLQSGNGLMFAPLIIPVLAEVAGSVLGSILASKLS